LFTFVLLAKDSPSQPAPKPLTAYAAVLRHADTWWFCLFYSVTFGGFVGLAVFLNSFFYLQYGLERVQAGYFATVCVIAGSFLRPVGGYLADRFGGNPHADISLCRYRRDDAGPGDLAAIGIGNRAHVRRHGECWGWATARYFSWYRNGSPRKSA